MLQAAGREADERKLHWVNKPRTRNPAWLLFKRSGWFFLQNVSALLFVLPPPSFLLSFKWQCTQRILFSISTFTGFAVLLVPGKTIVSRFIILDCFMLGLDGSKTGAATRREGWSGEAVVRSASPRGWHWHGRNSSWTFHLLLRLLRQLCEGPTTWRKFMASEKGAIKVDTGLRLPL